jgi:hypothetical protein
MTAQLGNVDYHAVLCKSYMIYICNIDLVGKKFHQAGLYQCNGMLERNKMLSPWHVLTTTGSHGCQIIRNYNAHSNKIFFP